MPLAAPIRLDHHVAAVEELHPLAGQQHLHHVGGVGVRRRSLEPGPGGDGLPPVLRHVPPSGRPRQLAQQRGGRCDVRLGQRDDGRLGQPRRAGRGGDRGPRRPLPQPHHAGQRRHLAVRVLVAARLRLAHDRPHAGLQRGQRLQHGDRHIGVSRGLGEEGLEAPACSSAPLRVPAALSVALGADWQADRVARSREASRGDAKRLMAALRRAGRVGGSGGRRYHTEPERGSPQAGGTEGARAATRCSERKTRRVILVRPGGPW
jgi:hypothetical protein